VTASYAFDFADRPQSLTVQVGATAPQAVASGASYLPSGPLTSLALGNGLTETRTYDDRYAPESIQVPGRLSWSYTTDAVDNILGITDTLDPSQNRTYGYQDVAYYLTQGDGPWGTRNWTYDRIGNRLTQTRDGATDTYGYQSNGTGNTAILDQVALSVGGTRDYQYGPAGHLEQVTAGANQVLFDSNAEGRLTSLSRPAADALARFEYDGRSFLTDAVDVEPEIFSDGFESGNLACWAAVTGGTKTGTCTSLPPPPAGETMASSYSSEGLLHSLAGAASAEHVLYFAGRPVAALEVVGGSGSLSYFTTDHLGTPVLATDGTGAEVWSGGFEPFGKDWNGAGAAGVFLRLPGQWENAVWEEAEMGAEVYYNVHRWYAPDTGRYSRPDPLGLRAGVNQYLYAGSNPLAFLDPDGRWVVTPNQIYPFSCSAAVASEARAAGRTRGWPWAHCYASCKIRKMCGGPVLTNAMGLGKELLDVAKCFGEIFGSGPIDPDGNCGSAFQPSDFEDNEFGLTCPPDQTCEERCAELEDKDPEPGPMYEAGIGTRWYLRF
jgi:RHS repeat-associated protein